MWFAAQIVWYTSEYVNLCKTKWRQCMCSIFIAYGPTMFIIILVKLAFDKVEYCKLFNHLLDRKLPPCIIGALLHSSLSYSIDHHHLFILATCDHVDTSASMKMPRQWAQRDRHQHGAMTAATDADGDWWLTREPWSSLHSTDDDSNASIQQRDRYMSKDGSAASVTRLGRKSRRFVYNQPRVADEDRCSPWVVVQRCRPIAGTVSGQELNPAAPRRTWQIALRR